MEVIVGTIILKNNKVLMVKEAKKECHGKWAFPAGHLEENESIFKGAIRETYEETGCEITLKKIFPILNLENKGKKIIMIHFLANLEKEVAKHQTNEILETKWFALKELKTMKKNEFRNNLVIEKIVKNLENKKTYNIDLILDL